ncbi:FimB/Mfa2 family fimbrial subunit [Sphingobacterium spiritivorum]|nr:FimB/Mfa2 family fimbrial subunit [Sphingobacterium spiritivorum]QQS97091.1 FimB/Mfa2 family fimbrial subunit [Sphingobacterium spiritivorum]
MKRIRLPILLIMCIYTVTLISCIKEKTIIDDTLPEAGNTTEVTFAVSMPGLSQNISTYAITDNEENKVSTIDVLVFEMSGGNEKYAYRVAGRNIRPLTANSIRFQATVQTDNTKKYRLVAIANARAAVNSNSIDYTVGTAKASILDKLLIDKPGVWNTTSSADYSPLPMWGESLPDLSITGSTGTIALNMLRSQARVDVKVEPTLAPVFRMTSISVYNSNANGRIAPEASRYNVGEKKVTSPSIPTTLQTNSTPLVYNISNPLKSEQEIYLFEKAAASAGVSGALSLIIGGHYDGSSTETYYKLEFLSAAATPVPLAVLRNHKYVFNIKEVSGEGYLTKAAALSGKPSNIQGSVVTINLGDMPVIYFDEHYYLAMQTDLVNFMTSQGTGQFYKIKTDFPGGWTWESDQPSWLSMNPHINGGNEGANIIVGLLPGIGDNPRHGILTITAGKIRARIKVYQGYGTNPLPDIP